MPYIPGIMIDDRFPAGTLKIDKQDVRDYLFLMQILSIPKRLFYFDNCSPVKSQENEGSCVGFGHNGSEEALLNIKGVYPSLMARVFLLESKYYDLSDRDAYEGAKLFDEYPGEDYEGSSIKGGLKAANKQGVCREKYWPYVPNEKGEPKEGAREDALNFMITEYGKVMSRYDEVKLEEWKRPREINLPPLAEAKMELIKQALYKHGPLFVGILVHSGWRTISSETGIIPYSPSYSILGGHAISLVGYDDDAQLVWFKNSWGTGWGKKGYGALTYQDVRKNMISVWYGKV